MAKTDNADSGSCFPAILRRFLCAGSLPTHPSEDTKPPIGHLQNPTAGEISKPDHQQQANKNVQVQATPGVVARLMGLDTLPGDNNRRTFGSYLRSRSVNYVDYLPQFDLIIQQGQLQGHHRRSKTSLSFREVPANRGQKNDLLFVCFEEDEEEVNERRLPETRSEVRNSRGAENLGGKSRGKAVQQKRKNQENFKKKKKKKNCRVMDEPKRAIDAKANCGKVDIIKSATQKKEVSNYRKTNGIVKTVEKKEASIGLKNAAKGRSRNKQASSPHTNSETSSPVSKIALHFSAKHPEIPSSGSLKLRRSSSKKSPPRATECDYPYPNPARVDEQRQSRDRVLMRNEEADYYCTRMAKEICRLTDEDLEEGESNWKVANYKKAFIKSEDFEDLCLNFEKQILDVLLDQFADELVFLHPTKNFSL